MNALRETEGKEHGDFGPSDFIREIVANHAAEKRYPRIRTRFPPEPNGYLHIGHAKSICLNFGIARQFDGICNLRMDDTNPAKEDVEFVESIWEDVSWLISGWADDKLGLKPKGKTPEVVTSSGKPDVFLDPVDNSAKRDAQSAIAEPFYASDYFDRICEYAETLIKKSKAYVCDLSPADTDAHRGAPDRPGKNSPFRNRSVAENLDLFLRMKNGEFPDGARTLRAKIDMASPNVWMRDPILYRIRHAEHHRTGAKWCIYPMYDFAHCLSDYIEGITHSICTLEFEVHRSLYDWILESLALPRPLPHQYEFSRLNLSYTVMSKRKLMQLVKEGVVSGWDDPRMPTISGVRHRGVTAEALRAFACNIGITKYNGLTDVAVFEHSIREDLNRRAHRRLAVLRPIKIIVTNYPGSKIEELDAINNPEDPNAGSRKIPFARTLYIEQDDFAETASPNFFRLKIGGEVRLKYAYIIKCDEVVKDASGRITELLCTADLDSKTGCPTANRKVKGTIHWVSAAHAIDAEVRLYDHLFTIPEPELMGDFKEHINVRSLEVVTAKCEPSLSKADPAVRYQFERLGYFTLHKNSSQWKPVFNRTITLQDQWAKQQKKSQGVSALRLNIAPARLANTMQVVLKPDEITVKGRIVKGQAVTVDDLVVVTLGKWLKTATIKDEGWLKAEAIKDPEQFLGTMRRCGVKADLFTFGQRLPDTSRRYNYFYQRDNVAAIRVTTFADWWEGQIAPDVRQNIKKARRNAVVVKQVPLDDNLVRGIVEIYNETPLRQGKPFYHYGKNFETAKRANSTYADQTEFIGAYFENELIGFLQLNCMGSIADIKQMISKNKHRDKKPGSMLIAKAVETCAIRGTSYLMYGQYHYYGNTDDDSLTEFKRRNGFQQISVPRYYVPLTLKGKIALRLNVYRGMKRLIPESVVQSLIKIRRKLVGVRFVQKGIVLKYTRPKE